MHEFRSNLYTALQSYSQQCMHVKSDFNSRTTKRFYWLLWGLSSSLNSRYCFNLYVNEFGNTKVRQLFSSIEILFICSHLERFIESYLTLDTRYLKSILHFVSYYGLITQFLQNIHFAYNVNHNYYNIIQKHHFHQVVVLIYL